MTDVCEVQNYQITVLCTWNSYNQYKFEEQLYLRLKFFLNIVFQMKQ